MNETVIFDTHRVVKRFVSVGFTEEQAEVLTDEQKIILENNLATKKDVAEIHFKIESLRKDIENLRKDIENLRKETKKDIETLRKETKKDIEIATKKMYIVLFTSIFSSIGFFVTVLKFLQLLKL